MSRWPSSLRSRLTLWYSLLLGLPLIAFAIFCYVVVARTLQRRTDRFIGDALTAFSRELVAERRATLSASQAIRSTVEEVRFRDLHIAVLDTSGKLAAITAFPNSDASESRLPSAAVGARLLASLRAQQLRAPVAFTVSTTEGDFRVVSRPLNVGAERFSLAGAYSLNDFEALLARIRGMFVIAVPLLVLCAAVGGYILAKSSLAPVSAMAIQAARIRATNLHERLPVAGAGELAGLARVVNDLLERLEKSFVEHRRFVADASHELRTPTAIIRTEADVTLSRMTRDEADYRASVSIMQDAARQLTRIVDDLFLLARADSGHLATRNDDLYLEEIVHDATRAVRSVAERRAVMVELRKIVEAPFRGDADLLGRLLLNLLDNAIRYSPEGGTVGVTMAREDGHYQIAVVDSGPGIPADARERVFEPFFRLDAARSRTESSATSGAGLGLAIARRIATMHAGQLDVIESRPGRTEFRLTLPVNGAPGLAS